VILNKLLPQSEPLAARDQKENTMVVVPLTQSEKESRIVRSSSSLEDTNWARVAAGGGLLAGGLLMLTGHRRAGLLSAASGTALALLDQQEVVRAWWDALPGYIEKVQRVVVQVEEAVNEVASQRERLHQTLTR
jgi:hypothetical protein